MPSALDHIWAKHVPAGRNATADRTATPTAFNIWITHISDFKHAITALLAHAQNFPDQTADVYALIARAYFNLQDFHMCQQYAEAALKLDPRNLDALTELAHALRSRSPKDEQTATQLEEQRTQIERERGMRPPADSNDSAGWDHFWRYQIAQEYNWNLVPLPELDLHLLRFFREHDIHSILFVGNGICQEPRLFAAAGFEAIALDLSPYATAFAAEFELSHPEITSLFRLHDFREGGTVQFVMGSLFDTTVCPGPFDAIITRRTLQGLSDPLLGVALARLLDRLHPQGIFINQSHNSYSSLAKIDQWLQFHDVMVSHVPPWNQENQAGSWRSTLTTYLNNVLGKPKVADKRRNSQQNRLCGRVAWMIGSSG
jgi:hypothetical protein